MQIEQRGVDTVLGSDLALGVIVFGRLPVSFGLGRWASFTSLLVGTVAGTVLVRPARAGLAAYGHQPVHERRRARRRARQAARLGHRAAAVAGLHRADPLVRRRRRRRLPRPARRAHGRRPEPRRGPRPARGLHRHVRGLRLPDAAATQPRPVRRADGAAGDRGRRVRGGLHHGRARRHGVPARRLLADLAARHGLGGPERAIAFITLLGDCTRSISPRRFSQPRVFRGGRGGPYWYRGGWNVQAAVAWAAGSGIGLPCVDTPAYSGPLLPVTGGIDLSFLISGGATAAVYLVLHAGRPHPVPPARTPERIAVTV